MRALIFDLDNCLAPADELGEDLLEPVFDAVRRTNRGTHSAPELDAAFGDCWFHAFDWVADRHRFTDEMRAAGWNAFRDIEVHGPMRGYGDLHLLPDLGEIRFLVTSGFRRLQESKVRALSIAHEFEEVLIDAVDESGRRGKEGIFAELMARYRLDADDVLIVGDNVESELAAARRLGVQSAQTVRPRIAAANDVDFHVRDLAELKALLATFETPR